jgi:hypothetical protein
LASLRLKFTRAAAGSNYREFEGPVWSESGRRAEPPLVAGSAILRLKETGQ